MFELTTGNLLQLLKAIDESGLESFSLKTGEFEVRVSCTPEGAESATSERLADASTRARSDSEHSASDVPASSTVSTTRTVQQRDVVARADGATDPASPNRDGGSPVAAPMVGTFYLAPEPGAAPFVQVGDEVTAQTTVGLVEAMKVFTAVPAGRDGVVVSVLVDNGAFVEYGQDLLLIADLPARPDPGAQEGIAVSAPARATGDRL